jgi:hypothetical protein
MNLAETSARTPIRARFAAIGERAEPAAVPAIRRASPLAWSLARRVGWALAVCLGLWIAVLWALA